MKETKAAASRGAGRRGLYAAIAGVAVLEVAYGCVGDENLEALMTEQLGSSQGALVCGGEFSVDARKSLFVSDEPILARFSFERVMMALTQQAGVQDNATDVYKRWWDSQAKKPGAIAGAAHCDDTVNAAGQGTLNGFPFAQCPRPEAELVSTLPFHTSSPDSYLPIALVNRFDLAPVDGSHCGEYRIIYAKKSGIDSATDRNLIIFEGVLPNPQGTGIGGCCQVAQFWAELSSDPSVTSRAARLESFYFTGLPGFAPVVKPEHYGMQGPGVYNLRRGQIRSNQFMRLGYSSSGPQMWTLKEFKLQKVCTTVYGPEDTSTTTCKLLVRPEPVKNNPYGGLFADAGSTQAFRDHVRTQVSGLQASSANGLTLNFSNTYNAAESPQGDPAGPSPENGVTGVSNYSLQAGSLVRNAIELQLAVNGNPEGLTADNILDRLETQSCMGCHQLSNGRFLGGSLQPVFWPASEGFTHSTERRKELAEDGVTTRFGISPALRNSFLPHRKQVLETYLRVQGNGGTLAPAGETSLAAGAAAGEGGPVPTLGGSVTH